MGSLEQMRFLTWNAQSVLPKKKELFDFLLSNKISIATVVETHLNSSKSISNPHFRILRLDRDSDRRGGGVALIIRRGVKYELLPCPCTEKSSNRLALRSPQQLEPL